MEITVKENDWERERMNEKKIRNKPNSNTRNNTDGRWMQMNRLNKWMNEWMTKMMMKMKWNELRASISFLYLRVCSIFYVWFDFFFKRILLSIFWSMLVKEGSQKKLWCYVLVCSIYVFLLMEHVGTWRVFFSLTLIHQWATFAYTTWLNNVLRPNIWKKRYGKTKGSLIFYVLCLCVSGSNSFICIQRIGVDWRPNTQMPS